MPDQVTLTIDDQPVSVPANMTILKAAEDSGITIPTICYHDACTSNALCRLCAVDVEGARTLQPACIAQVSQGMVVHTETERVIRARRTILEMLNSTVDLSDAPEIQAQMAQYQADPERFPEAEKREIPFLDDNPMFVRDYSKCVLCWRCVQVCADDAQYAYAINFSGRGFHSTISTFFDAPMPATTCVFCGQCVGVCPTGALKSKREHLIEQGMAPDEVFEVTRSERRRKFRRQDP